MDTAKRHEHALVPILNLLKEEKTVLEISTKCNLATRGYVQVKYVGNNCFAFIENVTQLVKLLPKMRDFGVCSPASTDRSR